MQRRIHVYSLFAFLVLTTSAAQARPLTFEFKGTGSGTVGSRSFNDAAFRLALTAETDANYQYTSSGSLIVTTAYYPTSLWIQGIGEGTLGHNRRIFCNKANNALGITGPTEGDLLDIGDPAFAPYYLDRPFGPVFEAYPSAWGQFKNVASGLGLVTFTRVRDVTFTVTPEPATAGLFLLGIVSTLGLRRRRAA